MNKYSQETIETALKQSKIMANLRKSKFPLEKLDDFIQLVGNGSEKQALIISEIMANLHKAGGEELSNLANVQKYLDKIQAEKYPPMKFTIEEIINKTLSIISNHIEDEVFYLSPTTTDNEQVVSVTIYDEVYRVLKGRVPVGLVANKIRNSLLRQLNLTDEQVVYINHFYVEEVKGAQGDLSIEFTATFHVSIETTHE